jgi:hypothetical protein
MKTLRFALRIALGIALPLAVQLWYRRRLDPGQRAVAWNGATWGAALYALGPLSMLGWCWVTRRGCPHTGFLVKALLPDGTATLVRAGRAAFAIFLGILWVAVLLAAISGADYLAALALGLEP